MGILKLMTLIAFVILMVNMVMISIDNNKQRVTYTNCVGTGEKRTTNFMIYNSALKMMQQYPTTQYQYKCDQGIIWK